MSVAAGEGDGHESRLDFSPGWRNRIHRSMYTTGGAQFQILFIIVHAVCAGKRAAALAEKCI